MAIQAIGSDYLADSGSTQTSSNLLSDTGFWSTLTAGTGNTIAEGLAYSGNTGGATIAAAATNATYSSMLAAGGSSTSTNLSSGLTSGASYLTGGSSAYSSTSTDVESILSESATSQAYLIGIQAQLGQQQSTFTAISNALNVKYSMERSAIQNFRS